MAEESIEQQVLKQLELIYSPENLEKDNFFREMTQQDPEGWVTLKKLSCIKRFKTLINGNLETLALAVGLSSEFEVNEDKSKLRKIPVPEPTPEELALATKEREDEAQRMVLDYNYAKNIRSVYAKGFDPEEQKDPIREYFQKFGRVVSLKMRFDDNKAFKGSVFVEYESPEVVDEIRSQKHEFKEKELLLMGKQEYIDMKAKEKFEGVEWTPLNDGRRQAYVIEFSGAEDMTITDIKKTISQKVKIGSVELLPEQKGCGVVQLLETLPEKFLESLEDKKIDHLTFRLADGKETEENHKPLVVPISDNRRRVESADMAAEDAAEEVVEVVEAVAAEEEEAAATSARDQTKMGNLRQRKHEALSQKSHQLHKATQML
ncbi:hypothetical protein DFQ28_011580 [Apophysomyces sp. BC1034]|nr:hypothetical protein DFQ30_008803 [Apophysomyces sp. BC1015]KAG0181720.1 hypothetical protein DFQ29_007386 [Apophysomyces sp. BC1021]KAG0191538.1 hypothetical protein DFQ28_011580 [Apophysomyces sp. BC1034]